MAVVFPTFSIIIPTYCRPKQVAVCLNAIAGLNYPREQYEVIVVNDGGSWTNATFEPQSAPLAVRFVEQAHLGPAVARNTGAEAATGKFLAFTDDDCMPHPDWLYYLALQLDQTPDCLLGGRTLNALPRNPYAAASQDLIGYLYSHFNAGSHNSRFFTSNNMAIPANKFRESGGFDQCFPFAAAEDRDFCDRWLHAGGNLAYVPEAVVYHAHNLTLAGFWRQHFHYGRGAYRFHRQRVIRTRQPLKLEPLSFYYRLITYPFAKKHGLVKGLLGSLLMMLSQLANAGGYFWERWTNKT